MKAGNRSCRKSLFKGKTNQKNTSRSACNIFGLFLDSFSPNLYPLGSPTGVPCAKSVRFCRKNLPIIETNNVSCASLANLFANNSKAEGPLEIKAHGFTVTYVRAFLNSSLRSVSISCCLLLPNNTDD